MLAVVPKITSRAPGAEKKEGDSLVGYHQPSSEMPLSPSCRKATSWGLSSRFRTMVVSSKWYCQSSAETGDLVASGALSRRYCLTNSSWASIPANFNSALRGKRNSTPMPPGTSNGAACQVPRRVDSSPKIDSSPSTISLPSILAKVTPQEPRGELPRTPSMGKSSSDRRTATGS